MSAGLGDVEVWRLVKILLLTFLLLGAGLTLCFPSSILFITASHLLGFFVLGSRPFSSSSFSLSMAFSLLPTFLLGRIGFSCSSSALAEAAPGPR